MLRLHITLLSALLVLTITTSEYRAEPGDDAHSSTQLLDTAYEDFTPRGPENEVTLVVDDECELTSELAGTWELDRTLAKDLAPSLAEERELKPNELGPITEFVIELEDAESPALDMLRDWLKVLGEEERFESCLPEFKDACRRVLAVGTFEETKKERSFTVIQWRGNLMMMIYRDNGVPDSMYISMACDRKAGNDYLFIREDRGNNAPFKRKLDSDE